MEDIVFDLERAYQNCWTATPQVYADGYYTQRDLQPFTVYGLDYEEALLAAERKWAGVVEYRYCNCEDCRQWPE